MHFRLCATALAIDVEDKNSRRLFSTRQHELLTKHATWLQSSTGVSDLLTTESKPARPNVVTRCEKSGQAVVKAQNIDTFNTAPVVVP